MKQTTDMPTQEKSQPSGEDSTFAPPEAFEWKRDTILVNGKPLAILFPQSEE